MGKDSDISWCHHSFNPWTRCTKISSACDNCYAETWAGRATHPKDSSGNPLPLWGNSAPRDATSAHNWRQPKRWNAEAAASGTRARVFCASLADVFEDHAAIIARPALFELIEATPHLDWLLLTKRPENMNRFAPEAWSDGWPAHVWAGTTAEDQKRADERIPHLLKVPARVRFLSVEPMLEAITLSPWPWDMRGGVARHPGIHWVICGGESGHHARPFDLAWARSLRDRCRAAGVPFFMKQIGAQPRGEAHVPQNGHDYGARGLVQAWRPKDKAGADPSEWPADLRVQEFPASLAPASKPAQRLLLAST